MDPERYREVCVGFTPGWADLPEAVTSLKEVVAGIPDLTARIEDGRIVERVQKGDTLSQMRQMYAGTIRKAATIGGVVGIVALARALRRRNHA